MVEGTVWQLPHIYLTRVAYHRLDDDDVKARKRGDAVDLFYKDLFGARMGKYDSFDIPVRWSCLDILIHQVEIKTTGYRQVSISRPELAHCWRALRKGTDTLFWVHTQRATNPHEFRFEGVFIFSDICHLIKKTMKFLKKESSFLHSSGDRRYYKSAFFDIDEVSERSIPLSCIAVENGDALVTIFHAPTTTEHP